MRTRNRHISVWMNEQEYRHLRAQAELAGMGIDPFIRSIVSGVQLRPRPPDTYTALSRAGQGDGRTKKSSPLRSVRESLERAREYLDSIAGEDYG